jgi:hypothetical protein
LLSGDDVVSPDDARTTECKQGNTDDELDDLHAPTMPHRSQAVCPAAYAGVL